MHHPNKGAAVPEPRPHVDAEPRTPPDAYATLSVGLAEVSAIHGHYATTTAGRFTLCAMALAVVVRVAARLPKDSRERRALARAAAELREVV